MITASEARLNVADFKLDEYNRIHALVEKLIPELDNSIKYQSKHGFSELTVFPYDNSRFLPLDRPLASEMINRLLTNHGYDVITNDYKQNVLKFKW